MAPRRKTPLSSVRPEAYPLLSREALGSLKALWRTAQVDRVAPEPQASACDFPMRLVGLVAQELPAWREVTAQVAETLVSRFPRPAAEPDWSSFAHGLMMATAISGDGKYQGPQPLIHDDTDVRYPCEQIIALLNQQQRGGVDALVGLAAQLHDQLYETAYHRPGRWFTRWGPSFDRGIVLALRIAPLDPDEASRVYEALWRDHGVDDDEGWHLNWPPELTGPSGMNDWVANAGALAFARELNDVERLEGLRRWFDARYGPAFEDGEFFYTFGTGDPWRRGIANVWAAMAHVAESGAMRRLYGEPNMDRHSQPTVAGIDYPNLAVRQAYYDPEKDALVVGTVAGVGRLGAPTAFKVTNLVDADRQVVVDGLPSDSWDPIGRGEIRVRTTIGDHTFVVR
jgi:hypothetical protein